MAIIQIPLSSFANLNADKKIKNNAISTIKEYNIYNKFPYPQSIINNNNPIGTPNFSFGTIINKNDSTDEILNMAIILFSVFNFIKCMGGRLLLKLTFVKK